MTQRNTKPPAVAIIDETACIGCTQCSQVCPTDAIIGAAKFMHTIINNACTGCGWCIPACPVDCITLIPVSPITAVRKKSQTVNWRHRAQQHKIRLAQQKTEQQPQWQTLNARRTAIADAVTRVKMKRQSTTATRDADSA